MVRAHPQVLLAALAQRFFRDAERPADFGSVQKGLILEQILEPRKDVSMPTGGLGFLVARSCRQALDQGVDQLMLQPVRRLIVGERSRAHVGRADGGLVEVTQFPQSRTRAPPPCDLRDSEFGSPQGAPISHKIVAR